MVIQNSKEFKRIKRIKSINEIHQINETNQINETYIINQIQKNAYECLESTSNTAIKIKEQNEVIDNIDKNSSNAETQMSKIKNLIKQFKTLFNPISFFKNQKNENKSSKNKSSKNKSNENKSNENKSSKIHKNENQNSIKTNNIDKIDILLDKNTISKSINDNELNIDNIISTISNIKNIGIEISDELDKQINVLDNIQTKTENITNDAIKYEKDIK
jgi:hypothetical protein